VALKAGVVAQAEELHVRGGRAGETRLLLGGITLNDALSDRALQLPLLAVKSASLVSGGMDAEYGGSLAGVLDVRTVDPGPRWDGEALWRTDGRRGTHFDRVSARIGGPLGVLGLGAVATADATLDDTYLPALRSAGRLDTWFGSFGWRADNRLLGHLKLAPVEARGGLRSRCWRTASSSGPTIRCGRWTATSSPAPIRIACRARATVPLRSRATSTTGPPTMR
jgi:hypothetical protein